MYGNPAEEDWGAESTGVEWHPFWLYDHESNHPHAFVIWWHHLDAVCQQLHCPFGTLYMERYTALLECLVLSTATLPC